MSPIKSLPPVDANDDIASLIETLVETERRLDELTAGEVDTVSGRDGAAFMLRHAQDRLRQSEADKQAAILDSLPAHIALLNNQGLIISVNESWRRFAVANVLHCPGYAVGINYLEICDSAQGDASSEARQVAAGIRAVLNGRKRSFSIEYPCHSPTEQRWFLMTVSPLSEDDPNGAVVMHLNITERKRSEDILRKASSHVIRKQRKKIWVEMGLLVFGTALSFFLAGQFDWFESVTHWVLANELAQLDEAVFASFFLLVGLSVFAYRRWHESQLELTSRWHVHAAMELLHEELDQRVKHRTAELDSSNQALYVEIAERKKSGEALRESEERFSGAFEHAPIGVALVSTEGRWLKVNQALCDLLGYSSAELLARTFQDITAPEDLERDLASMRRTLAGEIGSYQIQKRFIHASGRSMVVLLNVSLVRDSNGHPRYFIKQIQDITDRLAAEEALRKTEGQLRQSQKMEAVGQLAVGVAHDFNNLLTVIIGRAELLEDRADLPEKVLRNIKLIHETGSRAAVLTRQLLQFSRQQILQPRVIDLNALILGMQELLRRLISEDIELTFKLSAKLGKIKADPGQIEQVIMNLVINARDAMPKGGKISIETKCVEFDEKYCATHADATAGPHVMIAVADTGCGMDEKVRARIFEPFFTTKEIGKGTGLGLSTVYGIVKQSGGNIYVHSEVNHGTIFKVYFPEVKERAQAETSAAHLPVPGGGETILLVEDEANIRALLNEILTEKGYTVLVATDGEDAIARSKNHQEKIHLLLTDVVMPKMNGKEVASRLLQDRPDMKVIFMSGYTSDAIVSRGVLDQGIEFLEKPFTSTSVARRVRQVLDSPIAH